MDFTSFVITGPSTVTTSVGKAQAGQLTGLAAGKAVGNTRRCLYVHY